MRSQSLLGSGGEEARLSWQLGVQGAGLKEKGSRVRFARFGDCSLNKPGDQSKKYGLLG